MLKLKAFVSTCRDLDRILYDESWEWLLRGIRNMGVFPRPANSENFFLWGWYTNFQNCIFSGLKMGVAFFPYWLGNLRILLVFESVKILSSGLCHVPKIKYSIHSKWILIKLKPENSCRAGSCGPSYQFYRLEWQIWPKEEPPSCLSTWVKCYIVLKMCSMTFHRHGTSHQMAKCHDAMLPPNALFAKAK